MCTVRVLALHFLLLPVDAQQQALGSDGSECSSGSCSVKVPSLLQHARHASGEFPGSTTAAEDEDPKSAGGSGSGDGKGSFVTCDRSEETCYDENWSPTGCADYSEGCPCSANQVKCGKSDEWPDYAGYCTEVCCDMTQETCYDEDWKATGCADPSEGCPCSANQVKCGKTDDWAGYCTDVCCDQDREETCYDDTWMATGCASHADGGCPCPEGQAKCGADGNWSGWCQDATAACCDFKTQETCYDDNWIAESCAAVLDGGCPCKDGEVKCGATDEWPGYCTTECREKSLMESGRKQSVSHEADGKGKGASKGKSKGKATLKGALKGKSKGNSKGKSKGNSKGKEHRSRALR